jgi:sn-1 stearoyl-lipid 9-desaturase
MTTVARTKRLALDWPTIAFMGFLHGGALLALFPANFSWSAIGVMFLFHWITGGLGITLGFHRMLTHRSFQLPKPLEYLFAFCGVLACQGGIIDWVGTHRIHHLHSDTAEDPHDSNKGFFWSHFSWMLHELPMRKDIPRFARDLTSDPFYRFCNKFFIPIQIALAGLMYAWGGWSFVVWGVFVRLILVFHCTWLVNSATHMWGYRSHDSGDDSRNLWWVALTTYGEGWHNNHHAYQHSARHGLAWWEIDITWLTIRLLRTLGLATKVKLAEK